MKYMLIMQGTQADMSSFGTLRPEEIMAHVKFMQDLNEELKTSGELVAAEGLAGPEQAKIVRGQANGEIVVSDGPFAEAKEFLAGFWILDCESSERVVEIAKRITLAPGRGGAPVNVPVEIRQVMRAPGEEM
jgi:hypothetical protein